MNCELGQTSLDLFKQLRTKNGRALERNLTLKGDENQEARKWIPIEIAAVFRESCQLFPFEERNTRVLQICIKKILCKKLGYSWVILTLNY